MCGGVHNTRPSGGAELQGRGPRKCTVREQGPQQSTVRERRSVWWGPQHPSVRGGLSYRGEARGSVLQGSRGRSRVLYGSGGVCGGVHNTRPWGGGLSYRGEARGSVL